jgi:hypothetical protein
MSMAAKQGAWTLEMLHALPDDGNFLAVDIQAGPKGKADPASRCGRAGLLDR